MKINEINVGDKFTTQTGENYEIIETYGEGKETSYLVHFWRTDNWQIAYPHVIGTIRMKDSSIPHVYGVGYAKGTRESPVRTDGGDDHSYRTWFGMLTRCYKDGGIKSYKDVSVCEEWHDYMNFRTWYFEHVKNGLGDNFAIDKDLFGKGKRLYSPQTCCFLPKEINACIKAIKSFDNYDLKESSSKSVYVLSKLTNKYKDYLEERVVDVISGFINRYSEEYRKITKVPLESHYRRYELSKTDLSKVELTAFVEYCGKLIKFKNAGEMKEFIRGIEERELFVQKSSLIKK